MIKRLIRKELENFIPYNANQKPFKIKLDANESPFELPDNVKKKLAAYFLGDTSIRFYPDAGAVELRKTISEALNVDTDEIVVGNGSDQLIEIILNAFVNQGESVICPMPSFGMYKISTIIRGGTPVDYILEKENGYNYDIFKGIELIKKHNAKVIFLCTPNNPTGNVISSDMLLKLLKECPQTLVVVDEAYVEFWGESVAGFIKDYQNLIVLRTFSKAFGLAGIRCGYSISCKDIAQALNKVRPPYNIGSLSQLIAKLVLDEKAEVEKHIEYLKLQRQYLEEALKKIRGVHVYKSCANFILVKIDNALDVNAKLIERGIMVRDFINAPMLEDCLRISVGNKEQNAVLLEALLDILDNA